MIDIRPVGDLLGWLGLILGATMILPLRLVLSDRDPNARAFARAAVLSIVGGGVAVARAGSRKPALGLRRGVLLASGRVHCPAVAAARPMMLGAPHLGLADACLEGTSTMTRRRPR